VTRRVCAVGLGLLAWAADLAAQTPRTFTAYRQRHGETRLRAALEFGAGTARVAPGRDGELYRFDLTYDAERFVPVSDFDAGEGAVRLGLRPVRGAGLRVVSDGNVEQAASLALSPAVDVALDLVLGASEAELELGGLRLTELALRTGASETEVSFSRPNGTSCRRAEITAGAAQLEVTGLGNSRCAEIRVEAGMGKVALDFGGAWPADARATVRIAAGELTLRLPREVGVRLSLDRLLSSFEPAGLVPREDGAFVSPGYDRAGRRLDLELAAAVGGITVEWTEE
jgi:hypothetical protein